MRVIPTVQIDDLALKSHEKLFLDYLYGLTHVNSMDSHRVKCMNARTILRELHEEIETGRLSEEEIKGLCAETRTILNFDVVVSTHFKNALETISPALENTESYVRPEKKKDASDANFPDHQLKYWIADLSATLEQHYLDRLCMLLSSRFAAADVDAILVLTMALVSDLVARGWSLDSIHSWHRHFRFQQNYSFQQNLDFMLRRIRQPAQEHFVTLRINGATKSQSITEFETFRFSSKCDVTPTTNMENSFVSSGYNVVFAEGGFRGFDHTSAAIVARTELESLLDILRFEFEKTSTKIDSRILVVRASDAKTQLVTITNPVPNPVESHEEPDFREFCQKLDRTLKSGKIDDETKSRIRAAFRHYRFGRDSESYSDKFLNWWLGLETLTTSGAKNIGGTVNFNVSHAMLTGSLFRLLRDLLTTLRYLNIPWTDELRTASSVEGIRDTTVPQFIKLLQTAECRDQIVASLVNRPLVATQVQRIAGWLCDPKATHDQLTSHRERLRWHLARLYRIRCCIVHGSPIRFKLALFAANLESYLKQTLIFVLRAFHDHPHIPDLASLFKRNAMMWERQLLLLEDKMANSQTIADAVFADVVIRN